MPGPSLAPVVLFAYKRPKHTRATLVALAKNTIAAETDLFIFCDGPKRPQDDAAVSATREIVRRAKGFKSVTVFAQDKNKGLAQSVIDGVTQMFNRFEQVIVLEDDLVTSRHFLSYMNRALDHYRDQPTAFSVTGHTFPVSALQIPGTYPYDNYASYRCSSWSWGTWRNRWAKIDWGMDFFPAFFADAAQRKAFDRGGDDLSATLALQYEKKRDSWAIRFSYAHHAHDCHCIYPTKTLVRNIGLDNSGTHTRMDRRFIHPGLDDDWQPQRFCDAALVNPEIAQRFHDIFSSPVPSLQSRTKQRAARLLRLGIYTAKVGLERAFQSSEAKLETADILVVNAIQSSGGAARAAYRCFTGLRALQFGSVYLSLFAPRRGEGRQGVDPASARGRWVSRLAVLDRLSLRLYPRRKAEIFSPAFWANPARIRVDSYRANVVHLHWVCLGMLDLKELSNIASPIVWTLHDQWAFTGGCHYADSCDRFEQQCGECPVLRSSDAEDISNDLWLRKMEAYSKADLTVVAPSHWMASQAKRSSLLSGKRIEVIPNGLDTETFRPHDRMTARNSLGIEFHGPVLLFGAHQLSDRRKGGDILAQALRAIDFPCIFLVFGEGEIDVGGNPHVHMMRLGNVEEDEKLALMYSAADVFVCPSRMDNLPNTVAEAMACGLPCVAFDVGGLPDMVRHKSNGWLARPFETDDLVRGINWVTHHDDPSALRRAAREKALAEYSLPVMSARYQALFSQLLSESAGQ